MRIYLFFVLGVAFFTTSCRQEMLYPHQYMKWIKDEHNGLKVKKTIANYEFSLQYKPSEYILFDQLKTDKILKKQVDERRKSLDGLQYYTFGIKAQHSNEILQEDISSENEYGSRLDYFTSAAQDDIYLVENGDTLPCVLYHFERNYGLSPLNSIVLGFEKTSCFFSSDKLFIYNDKILNTGPVQFSIRAKDIQQIPSIRYEQN